MESGTNDARGTERPDTRPWERWMSCGSSGPTTAGCCGTDAGKMAEGWPCGAVFREHRFAVFAVLSGIGLTFLIGFAGCILGIIAFIRTL